MIYIKSFNCPIIINIFTFYYTIFEYTLLIYPFFYIRYISFVILILCRCMFTGLKLMQSEVVTGTLYKDNKIYHSFFLMTKWSWDICDNKKVCVTIYFGRSLYEWGWSNVLYHQRSFWVRSVYDINPVCIHRG